MWYFTLHFTLVPALIIALVYLLLAAVIPVIVLRFFNKVLLWNAYGHRNKL